MRNEEKDNEEKGNEDCKMLQDTIPIPLYLLTTLLGDEWVIKDYKSLQPEGSDTAIWSWKKFYKDMHYDENYSESYDLYNVNKAIVMPSTPNH